jgi:hypothetical protein
VCLSKIGYRVAVGSWSNVSGGCILNSRLVIVNRGKRYCSTLCYLPETHLVSSAIECREYKIRLQRFRVQTVCTECCFSIPATTSHIDRISSP